jgi:predicted phage tail protein
MKSMQEKKVLFSTVARAVLLGVAFIATVWAIGALNSGSLFTGDNPTASLLAIPAQRSH